jgi:hypothetical protein
MIRTQSGIFTTFYYLALIAWTIASLGLAGQFRKDLRTDEFVLIFFSTALTATGWSLPLIQNKHPENSSLNLAVFFFPVCCSAMLFIGFLLAFGRGAG